MSWLLVELQTALRFKKTKQKSIDLLQHLEEWGIDICVRPTLGEGEELVSCSNYKIKRNIPNSRVYQNRQYTSI